MKIKPALFVFLLAVMTCLAGFNSGCGGRQDTLQPEETRFEPVHLEPSDMKALLNEARRMLFGAAPGVDGSVGSITMFRPERRPVIVSLVLPGWHTRVASAIGTNLADSVAVACRSLAAGESTPPQAGWLKLDVAGDASVPWEWDPNAPRAFDRIRTGLIFWTTPVLALTPGEIMGRHLFDGTGRFQAGALKTYLRERGCDERAIERLTTGRPRVMASVFTPISFAEAANDPKQLIRYRGWNSESGPVDARTLKNACGLAADYLLAALDDNGKFRYLYRPDYDLYVPSYNILRHAGTLCAMLEWYEAVGDERVRVAAAMGLKYLLSNIRIAPFRGGAHWVVVSADTDEDGGDREVVKLGGNALAILALCQYVVVTGDRVWLSHAEALAAFILASQNPNGHFLSEYDLEKGERRDFDSLYYSGEAILSLVRLYRLKPDPRYLEAACRGADWLIREWEKTAPEKGPDDSWLMMALDELWRLRPEPRYREHVFCLAQRMVATQQREETISLPTGVFSGRAEAVCTATRMEGLAAACRLAAATGHECAEWREALRLAAGFQMRCQFTTADVLYLPKPLKALGGFHNAEDQLDIRIDTVQHSLSGLLGLGRFLEAESMHQVDRRPGGNG